MYRGLRVPLCLDWGGCRLSKLTGLGTFVCSIVWIWHWKLGTFLIFHANRVGWSYIFSSGTEDSGMYMFQSICLVLQQSKRFKEKRKKKKKKFIRPILKHFQYIWGQIAVIENGSGALLHLRSMSLSRGILILHLIIASWCRKVLNFSTTSDVV